MKTITGWKMKKSSKPHTFEIIKCLSYPGLYMYENIKLISISSAFTCIAVLILFLFLYIFIDFRQQEGIWKSVADVHYDALSRHYITHFWTTPPHPLCWHLFKIQPLICVHHMLSSYKGTLHPLARGGDLCAWKQGLTVVQALILLCSISLQTGNLLASQYRQAVVQ